MKPRTKTGIREKVQVVVDQIVELGKRRLKPYAIVLNERGFIRFAPVLYACEHGVVMEGFPNPLINLRPDEGKMMTFMDIPIVLVKTEVECQVVPDPLSILMESSRRRANVDEAELYTRSLPCKV